MWKINEIKSSGISSPEKEGRHCYTLLNSVYFNIYGLAPITSIVSATDFYFFYKKKKKKRVEIHFCVNLNYVTNAELVLNPEYFIVRSSISSEWSE